MSRYSGHRYIAYFASQLPRKGADFQEAAWDDKMKAMVYDKLSDAVNNCIHMKRMTNNEYSVYRQPLHGKGERDPIATTATWAIVDNTEYIDVGEYV